MVSIHNSFVVYFSMRVQPTSANFLHKPVLSLQD